MRRSAAFVFLISIHAPHAGCDMSVSSLFAGALVISIHAPHAGCDSAIFSLMSAMGTFQSTHPMRGATAARRNSTLPPSDFNPRTPCGVRPAGVVAGDVSNPFQSTHPMRGATCRRRSRRCGERDFNPRTPCGVRQYPDDYAVPQTQFQSTHPMRGATIHNTLYTMLPEISIHAPHAGCDAPLAAHFLSASSISIHAPHAGCDSRCGPRLQQRLDFNPRTPCGVRQKYAYDRGAVHRFQSTHPMRGATMAKSSKRFFQGYFNPRTPCGVRHVLRQTQEGHAAISIHAPHAGCD